MKYNLILLAGGEDELWCQKYGHKRKAFLPLLGKPMINWVIEAFQASEYIDNIIVVGPKGLAQLDSMRYVRKHLIERSSFIQNLLYAAFYIKALIYKFTAKHNGYLISFCDAALLTKDIINATLKIITETNPEVALIYVKKETIAASGYPVENRTYTDVLGKAYTSSNIYYVKKITILMRALKDIMLIRKFRKEPKEIFRHLGIDNKDISGIEEVLSKRLATKIKIFISPHAEMGVDVDKPVDYEQAKIQLMKRHKKDDKVECYQ